VFLVFYLGHKHWLTVSWASHSDIPAAHTIGHEGLQNVCDVFLYLFSLFIAEGMTKQDCIIITSVGHVSMSLNSLDLTGHLSPNAGRA